MRETKHGEQRRFTALPRRLGDLRGDRHRDDPDPLRNYHECRAYRHAHHGNDTYHVDCVADLGQRGRHRGPHRDAAGNTWSTPDGWWP